MASYHIETYGCTSNRGESRQIERALRDGGHHPVEAPAEADVSILNSCTVVEKTERNMLRRAKELNEQTADLIVTGCMALAQSEEFAEADVDAQVLHWDDVPTAVSNGECPTPTPDAEPILDGVIGILPIARGCMSDCSYCITKQATGKIDSPPVEENVEHARALVHAGAKELRITGQDTGVYGWEQGERKLAELLDRICDIDGEFRIRVGMANPKGIHGIREDLAAVFAENEKIYNFIHAPVQSGSDDVLGDMRRQHQVREFREVVETFDSTDAADMDGLGGTLKKERSKAMTELKMDVVAEAYESMIGDRREVLVVEQGTGDSVKCRDGAYRQVIVQNATDHEVEPGEFLEVEITSHQTVYAFGTPV